MKKLPLSALFAVLLLLNSCGSSSEDATTVKIKDYAGRRDEWEQEYEYDKMMTTYHNIKRLTGIED